METLVNVKEGAIALLNKGCSDTGSPNPMAAEPKLMVEGFCDPTAGDDDCVSCAKSSCCDDYQACVTDTNCNCLIECLGTGNPAALCTMSTVCGPADSISAATASCLQNACPAQCVNNMGSMGGSCSCGSATSSSGGAGPPACTPGSTGAGESCFSDGDCASCVCNNDFCN